MPRRRVTRKEAVLFAARELLLERGATRPGRGVILDLVDGLCRHYLLSSTVRDEIVEELVKVIVDRGRLGP
jgi:hypothetical protein